jgi:hypothetical protein
MNEFISTLFITILSLPSFVALLIMLGFLLPNRIEYVQDMVAHHAGRALVVGFVNLLFFGILAGILSNNGGDVGSLLAILIVLTMLGLAALGLSGLMYLLRLRMYPPTKETTLSPIQTAVRAALVLLLALLSPFIGWFVLAPILLSIGLGAGIMAVVRRSRGRVPLQQQI